MPKRYDPVPFDDRKFMITGFLTGAELARHNPAFAVAASGLEHAGGAIRTMDALWLIERLPDDS